MNKTKQTKNNTEKLSNSNKINATLLTLLLAVFVLLSVSTSLPSVSAANVTNNFVVN